MVVAPTLATHSDGRTRPLNPSEYHLLRVSTGETAAKDLVVDLSELAEDLSWEQVSSTLDKLVADGLLIWTIEIPAATSFPPRDHSSF